jgi:methylthioribose-1-phosphate isomerase
MANIEAIRWVDGNLVLIDQTKIPLSLEYYTCRDYGDVIHAIKEMIVRGAPAIGAAAAYGVATAARDLKCGNEGEYLEKLEKACQEIYDSRPTAVNLMWAVDRQRKAIMSVAARSGGSPTLESDMERELLLEANLILKEDIETNMTMAGHGQEVVGSGYTILTHCNTGALATGGYGTALGVVRKAHESGKNVFVFADETRPRLQGGKLTAWELLQEGIPSKLIVDSTAATLIRDGRIDVVLVGADRITRNGDTANKIGTFMLSSLAKTYNVPFYVVAPTTTIDFDMECGSMIEIEERDKSEMTHMNGIRVLPDEIECFNPAFDVTPNENISGIITEKGILRPPFSESIAAIRR